MMMVMMITIMIYRLIVDVGALIVVVDYVVALIVEAKPVEPHPPPHLHASNESQAIVS